MSIIQQNYNTAFYYIGRLGLILQELNAENDKKNIYNFIEDGHYFFKAEQAVDAYADAYFKAHGKNETLLTNQVNDFENQIMTLLIKHINQSNINDTKAISLAFRIINTQSNSACVKAWDSLLLDAAEPQIEKIHNLPPSRTPAQNYFIDYILGKQGIVDSKTIKSFFRSGGTHQIINAGDKVSLNQSDRFIVGCQAGSNRSQVLYMIMNENKCNLVLPPIAGGASGMNPAATMCYVSSEHAPSAKTFQEALGVSKVPILGSNEFPIDKHCWGQEGDLAKAFYQKKIDELMEEQTPLKILAFPAMVESAIARLVRTGKSLNNVEIIFFDIEDYIGKPIKEKIQADSKEAYLDFYSMLKEMITINK